MFVISCMSNSDYTKLINTIRDYSELSASVFEAIIRDSRMPQDLINTKIKPEIYMHAGISKILNFERYLKTHPEDAIDTLLRKFGGTINSKLLTYILTNNFI